MVCKIFFCFKFPDNLDTAGKKTSKRGRKTQVIAKRYAFHANVTRSGDDLGVCNSKLQIV